MHPSRFAGFVRSLQHMVGKLPIGRSPLRPCRIRGAAVALTVAVAMAALADACSSGSPITPGYHLVDVSSQASGIRNGSAKDFLAAAGCSALVGRPHKGVVRISTANGGVERYDCSGVSRLAIIHALATYRSALASDLHLTLVMAGQGEGYYYYAGDAGWCYPATETSIGPLIGLSDDGQPLYTTDGPAVTGDQPGGCYSFPVYLWDPGTGSGSGDGAADGGEGGSFGSVASNPPAPLTLPPPKNTPPTFIPIEQLLPDSTVADSLDCTVSHSDPGEDAYCKGKIPTDGDSLAILAAILRIKEKSQTCAPLGNILLALFDAGDIHIAPAGFKKTGSAPQGARGSGYVVLNPVVVRMSYPSSVGTMPDNQTQATLQWALAHEADHLLDNRAPNGDVHLPDTNRMQAPNSMACSDLPQ